MTIDIKTFRDLVNKKYLSAQKHDKADLLIWNYTQKCQYEGYWTPETMKARGLITNKKGDVIARPFSKFFNLVEHTGENSKLPPLPVEEFEVFDKLDGSLGILYWLGDKPYIATRGSFNSDQAVMANKILSQKYKHVPWDREKTYLFEIIYPENRIVVDYGKTTDLFLLAVLNTETGEEMPYDWCSYFAGEFELPIVDRFYGMKDLEGIKVMLGNICNNAEGFVIRFKSGVRVKIKYDEYVRLHRLVTGVNAKTIWELLRNNQPFDELMERVPDEFYDWVKNTKASLNNEFEVIEQVICSHIFDKVKDLPTRKDQAIAIMSDPEDKKYSAVVFKMLDKQPYEDVIWKMIQPRADKPWREDIDV